MGGTKFISLHWWSSAFSFSVFGKGAIERSYMGDTRDMCAVTVTDRDGRAKGAGATGKCGNRWERRTVTFAKKESVAARITPFMVLHLGRRLFQDLLVCRRCLL
jgi:hypothetical protein